TAAGQRPAESEEDDGYGCEPDIPSCAARPQQYGRHRERQRQWKQDPLGPEVTGAGERPDDDERHVDGEVGNDRAPQRTPAVKRASLLGRATEQRVDEPP